MTTPPQVRALGVRMLLAGVATLCLERGAVLLAPPALATVRHPVETWRGGKQLVAVLLTWRPSLDISPAA